MSLDDRTKLIELQERQTTFHIAQESLSALILLLMQMRESAAKVLGAAPKEKKGLQESYADSVRLISEVVDGRGGQQLPQASFKNQALFLDKNPWKFPSLFTGYLPEGENFGPFVPRNSIPNPIWEGILKPLDPYQSSLRCKQIGKALSEIIALSQKIGTEVEHNLRQWQLLRG